MFIVCYKNLEMQDQIEMLHVPRGAWEDPLRTFRKITFNNNILAYHVTGHSL